MMELFKEYFLKSFLLVGGSLTGILAIEVYIFRLLSLYKFGTLYTVTYFTSIFVGFFIACYFNYRLSDKGVSGLVLRIKNQVMANLPMLVMLFFLSKGPYFQENGGVIPFFIAWNVMFLLVNLFYTYLILKLFKKNNTKNLVDVIDQDF